MRGAPITLFTRDEAAHTPRLWSRDDTRFVIVAPFLVVAAIFCPKRRWHQSASLIDSIGSRSHESNSLSQSEIAVCQRLGINQGRLRQIIAASRVHRTEHLIHVIHSLANRNWVPRFEITGKHHLDDALRDGKGAVLWVAHFSFASLFTKMALSGAGYKISHISRPEHGVSKSRLGIRYLNWFRSVAENRYLSRRIVHLRHKPGTTKEAAVTALRNNELLSITVGAWEGRHLATGDLLGTRYTVSTGAPAFAFANGAKLLPVFTLRDADNGDYRVGIGGPLGELARASLDNFVRVTTLELFSLHEAEIRKRPEQWRGWNNILPKSQIGVHT
jgi:lauroyl/myristoyl acyltransferase